MKVQFSNTNFAINNYNSTKNKSANSNNIGYQNHLNNSKQVSFSGGLSGFFKKLLGSQEGDLAKIITTDVKADAKAKAKEPLIEYIPVTERLAAEKNKVLNKLGRIDELSDYLKEKVGTEKNKDKKRRLWNNLFRIMDKRHDLLRGRSDISKQYFDSKM